MGGSSSEPNLALLSNLRLQSTSSHLNLGLGSASLVGLAEARLKATEYRKIAREGGDPDVVRKRESLSFREAADRVHAQLKPTWRNRKHSETWLSTVANYAVPSFGDRRIHTLGPADILSVLSPIWVAKHETAKRLLQRLSTIFDWAKGAGHYPHENPVNGVRKALPVVRHVATHIPAMPWKETPTFMQELSKRESVSARTLEFIILTAVRSGETRGARWSEFDLNEGTWTIPGQRMKRGIPHRVPLSDHALALLEFVKPLDNEWVFPSNQLGKDSLARPQSVTVFKSLFKRMGCEGFTVHGFRSTFRDWCSEYARADREVAEAALAHSTGSQAERAYARSDLFERRRALMVKWSDFLTNQNAAVLEFAAR